MSKDYRFRLQKGLHRFKASQVQVLSFHFNNCVFSCTILIMIGHQGTVFNITLSVLDVIAYCINHDCLSLVVDAVINKGKIGGFSGFAASTDFSALQTTKCTGT